MSARSLAVLVLALVAGCGGIKRCKDGTLLLSVTLEGPAATADALNVDVALDGGGDRATQVPLKTTSGTIEVDFPSYPKGQTVTVTVTALAGAAPVGVATQMTTLGGSCATLALTISGSESSDLGSGDGFSPLDLAMPDMALPIGLSVFAGDPGGYGHLDGAGTAARLNQPIGVAVDTSTGALYVADFSYTIRKGLAASGQVSTFVGTYPSGIGVVDGTGAAAQFVTIWGAAFYSGTLYICDQWAIRAINPTTAVVTTVAGDATQTGVVDGTGTAARFEQFLGCATDNFSGLYVTDWGGKTVRRVTIPGYGVTTVAGKANTSGSADGVGAAALFAGPRGVVEIGSDSLYVTDTDNNTIRKIVISTQTVTTYAGQVGVAGSTDGTGTAATFSAPWGITADIAQTSLFVADSGTGIIRKINLSNAAVTTVAGKAGLFGSTDGVGATARFSKLVSALTRDNSGNLYISDSGNAAIRLFSIASGAVTTLTGDPPHPGATDGPVATALLSAPTGVVADASGTVFVADSGSFSVRKVSGAATVSTLAGSGMPGTADGTGTAASFGNLGRFALTPTSLLLTDASDTIRQLVLGSNAVTTVAGTAGANGAVDATGASARFNGPSGAFYDGTSAIYVADSTNCIIRKVVVATGVVTTVAGTALMCSTLDQTGTAARFNVPQGITGDGSGNLYVTESSGCVVRKLQIANGQVTTVAGTAGTCGFAEGTGAAARFSAPRGIAADANGNLYVADFANHAVRKIVAATGQVTTVVGAPARVGVATGPLATASVNGPSDVTLLPNGDLLVADTTENVLLRVH